MLLGTIFFDFQKISMSVELEKFSLIFASFLPFLDAYYIVPPNKVQKLLTLFSVTLSVPYIRLKMQVHLWAQVAKIHLHFNTVAPPVLEKCSTSYLLMIVVVIVVVKSCRRAH